MLNIYILLPDGSQEFVGSQTNLAKTAVANSQHIISQVKLCEELDIRERDTAMASAITATESTFVGAFEQTLEKLLYQNFKTAALWLNLSIGPAQLKQDRFSKHPNLNPLDLCNAVMIVLRDIKKARKISKTFNWPNYLMDYNGSSPSNIHGVIYASYVLSIYDSIADSS